ncbi:Uncharacterised protein [Escherichia coli]|uniref:Uncharacterized protein n=1 Tax=Escherichia coli TaxID=562 RepID=A0ABD7WC42_ECOLX|nr:Uncharacterised protein [Escherichia coli]
MSEIRFVTLASDINNIKEVYSDDELKRLLEAVNQNCPARIVIRRTCYSLCKQTNSV